MKTNVIMESCENRTLQADGIGGVVIKQRTKDKYFAMQDLILFCDRWAYIKGKPRFDIQQYFRLDSTKAFLNALRDKKGKEPYIKGKKGQTAWLHPHLFLDILLWANPEFKVEIYDWLYDYLIESRVNSSDSYRLMCGVLYEFCPRKDKFKKALTSLAQRIKEVIGVEDWNKASELQLQRRDELQTLIADLTATMRRPDEAVRLSFENYRRKYGA